MIQDLRGSEDDLRWSEDDLNLRGKMKMNCDSLELWLQCGIYNDSVRRVSYFPVRLVRNGGYDN